jgi:hypothetical protein
MDDGDGSSQAPQRMGVRALHTRALMMRTDALAAVSQRRPESVQSLSLRALTSSPRTIGTCSRRRLVGRRFDPDLVAVVGGASGTAQRSFAAMEAFDLIRRVEGSNDLVFKHSLVRDALRR